MDEEEIKIKMDDGVARFFTRLRGNFLFVDLWEAQPCPSIVSLQLDEYPELGSRSKISPN